MGGLLKCNKTYLNPLLCTITRNLKDYSLLSGPSLTLRRSIGLTFHYFLNFSKIGYILNHNIIFLMHKNERDFGPANILFPGDCAMKIVPSLNKLHICGQD